MIHPPKRLVRRSFENAAPGYDKAAQVQRLVCEHLASGLPQGMAPGTVLDAGCGTGFALGMLGRRFERSPLIGLDISQAMVARVQPPNLRLAGDVEHLPLSDASIDLYWSSLTLQWCRLDQAMREAHRVLRPGGHLAVATLGGETFGELRHAFALADRHRHTLDFMSADEVAAAASEFAELSLERRSLVEYHPDLRALLRAIKASGASQVSGSRRVGLMSRGTWRQVEERYEALRHPAGLPLTYDVITLHGKK